MKCLTLLYPALQYFSLQELELSYTTDNFQLPYTKVNCDLKFILTVGLNGLHQKNL